MKMRISYAFFLILVVHIGLAWGQDLKITLENEVAVITPDMVILPQEKGSLEGRTNSETLESSEKRPPFNNRYKEHRKSYVSKDKTVAAIKYGNAGFIESGLAPVGIVAKLFDNKLGTNGGIDEVFVDIGKRQGIEKGDRFTVYSKERMIYHPIHLGDRLFKEDTRRVWFCKK